MKYSVSVVLIVLIGLVSCNKKNNTDTHVQSCSYSYITSEILNFKFKKGSYWIYMDSISLTIDTMRIDSVLFNGFGGSDLCYKNMEAYRFRVNKKTSSSVPNEYSLQANKLMLNQKDILGSGTEIYLDSSPKIDSLFIYDRYYKSVVSYTHTNEPSENNNKTVFYTNTTFGFLKKEVYSSTNQLISQKLLKDKFIIR